MKIEDAVRVAKSITEINDDKIQKIYPPLACIHTPTRWYVRVSAINHATHEVYNITHEVWDNVNNYELYDNPTPFKVT